MKKALGGRLLIRVNRDGHTLISASISGKLSKKKDGTWIGYCPPLDLYTCGATREEMLKNTQEAIELFFESCIRRGTLDEALRELNWEKDSDINADGISRMVPKINDCVPPAFVIDKIHPDSWQGHVTL
jgi:predicted RNase H-like HicB family nuclease